MPGNLEALRDLQRKIAGLGRATTQRQLGAKLARTGIEQLRTSVAASRDPYGKPFAPLVGSNRPPLRRIVALFAATPNASGFGIRASADYVRFHQEGAELPARRAAAGDRATNPKTGRFLSDKKASKRKLVTLAPTATTFRAGEIPQRQLVPEAATGGMGTWGEPLNETADAWLRSYLGVT